METGVQRRRGLTPSSTLSTHRAVLPAATALLKLRKYKLSRRNLSDDGQN